jgi:hypothetical protein
MTELEHYCTLFDAGYLSRGLVMIESLLKASPHARIYVFAFDDLTFNTLNDLSILNVVPISLKEFEDAELLRIKSSRSRGEYCWTSTPSTILYCIEKFNLQVCTYVDADLYFFSSPLTLIEEMGEASVLITPHWYTPRYDQTQTSGIYCVQFLTIKNTPEGMAVVRWWRERCIEWCYAKIEDGKFGDQKYLDDWTSSFEGVHVLENRGGGMAPWNIQQYRSKEGKIWVQRKKPGEFLAIFYHFHALHLINDNTAFLGDYFLSKETVQNIYLPYLKKLALTDEQLFKKFEVAKPHKAKKKIGLLRTLKRTLQRTLNLKKF